MYFYSLSEGCYSDYSEIILYHKSQFTKEEFVKMFNEAIDQSDKKYVGYIDISEYLIDNCGFKKVEAEIEIGADYGSYRKLTREDYTGDFKYIDAENKSYLK